MSALTIMIILCAVSAALMALGCFVRPLGRVCGVLTFLWLIAALPIMFFLNVSWDYVFLFYLISSAFALIFHYGGRPA